MQLLPGWQMRFISVVWQFELKFYNLNHDIISRSTVILLDTSWLRARKKIIYGAHFSWWSKIDSEETPPASLDFTLKLKKTSQEKVKNNWYFEMIQDSAEPNKLQNHMNPDTVKYRRFMKVFFSFEYFSPCSSMLF